MAENWTVLRVLEWTTGRFQRAGLESARLEAQVLLGHVLGCDRVALYTGYGKPLNEDELGRYRGLIQRRLGGEPLAYLVGEQEFWSLPFRVDHAVLIPRRDTETLIEAVLDHYVADRQGALSILDLATGTGAIGVTLAKELAQAQVLLTDVSEAAIAVARGNAARNGVGERVTARVGDLFGCLEAGQVFDLVVSNPPYVPTGELTHLAAEVRAEPRLALDGGADGLDVLRRLVAAAPAHVRPGGALVLEHGFDQATAVAGLIDATGAFEAPRTYHDPGGHPRVTCARRLEASAG